MADTLGIGVSGLLAFQRALDTTSNNIANASTPGYSRQTVELATRIPAFGGGSIGNGVAVKQVVRSYDELLGVQQRSTSSTFSRLDAFSTVAASVNNLFSNSATGLSAQLQKFSAALQGVADEPTSIPARQVLLSEANALTERLDTYDTRLRQLDAEVNTRFVDEAQTITSLAASIADVNARIVQIGRNATGQPPNDLLDQRSQLLSELSTHINVNTVAQDDGAVNVFIGNGQSLVLGNTSATIGAQRDAYDADRYNITYDTPGISTTINSELSGGTLGGLIDARRELLDPARNQLGQIAAGIASAVNAQHREGMDLQGNLGGDVFSIGGVQVLARAGNPGTASIAATRGNIGQLTTSDYELQYVSGAWQLRNLDTGANVALAGAGTPGSPFTADGLSLVVSGTPADGARYLIRPTADAVQGMAVAIDSPAQIAAAAPIRTAAGATNLGTGRISAGEVTDATNASLRSPVSIQFLSATTYSVNGAGTFTYTAGSPININGWTATITGAPQTGDTFAVGNNTNGVGDNRNAQLLGQALDAGLLQGGTRSLNDAVGGLIGNVGVQTNQAQSARDAQKVVLDDANAQIDSVSGVNLDEEAANMLRYQQAYQAMAQVIRTSQNMFDSLLAATSR